MVTDRKPHLKGRVDVVFKNGPNIIKQNYMILTVYTVNHCITQFPTLVFLRECWDGDPLGTARAKASNRCRFYVRVAFF